MKTPGGTTLNMQSILQSRRDAAMQRRTDVVALAVGMFVLWSALSAWLGVHALPYPWTTFARLGSLLGDPGFYPHVAETGKAFAAALVLAVLGGTVLGIMLGVRRLAGDVMEPVLIALYSVPKISLYPIILLIFGLGISAKIAFGVIHGIIPIVLFTMTAVRNIRPVFLRCIKVHRMSPGRAAWQVLIPAAIPEVVAGLRIGFALTLLGTLLGEMFASQRGLGHMLMMAIERHDVALIMALAVLLFAFATLASLLLLWWDRHLRKGWQRGD